MKTMNSKPFASLLVLAILTFSMSYAQTIESVTFSAVSSSDDNFQPVMGTPYGASLSGANGSLEISASYGEGSYEESTLSVEELELQSGIRVFPNPSSYKVNVDLSKLPLGEYQLFLVDLSGRMVYSQRTSARIEQIDLSPFATGTYVLQVQASTTRRVETFRVIKIQ